MKISDLQHLEVISEETKIEGGATFGIGASAFGRSNSAASSNFLTFGTLVFSAGGSFGISSTSTADTLTGVDPEGNGGSFSESGSLSSINLSTPA